MTQWCHHRFIEGINCERQELLLTLSAEEVVGAVEQTMTLLASHRQILYEEEDVAAVAGHHWPHLVHRLIWYEVVPFSSAQHHSISLSQGQT